jgi:isoquinoline 1-oxidoreductase beta subunit
MTDSARPGTVSRRGFLRAGAAAGGGLLVGIPLASARWPDPTAGEQGLVDGSRPESQAIQLNAFVEVRPDGRVRVVAPCPELGQGVRTSLAMIVAEELGADWSVVEVEQAPAGEGYGSMTVGGSNSVANYWEPLRTAGAVAREMLVAAAAAEWSVAPEECEARSGAVLHTASGRSAGFGQLATAASELPIPDEPELKDPDDFQIVGTRVGPVDGLDMVTGRAQYGFDVQQPGMLIAVVERSPVHGGRLVDFEATEALAVPGVRKVVEVEPLVIAGQLYGAVRSGVAVIAENTWAAMKGRDALRVRWDDGYHASESSADIYRRLRERARAPGEFLLREPGGSREATQGAAELESAVEVSAEYELPLLAHGCMEPINFTGSVQEDRCEVWGPTQTPRFLQAVLAAGLELPRESVSVQPTLSGGGFGRRLAFDYGIEAAMISRSAGVPVKVVWTREDDMRQDYYRTPSWHALSATLSSKGLPTAWRHHVISTSLARHSELPRSDREPPHPGIYDVQGAADLPYAIERVTVEYSPVDVGLQMGSWRSVAHSFNVFAVESFLDEIAVRGGRDPLELRLDLLPGGEVIITLPLPGRRGRPRPDRALLRRVLRAAAERADWGSPLPPGRGRGIACCYYKQTYAAHVADVTVEAGGSVRVDRVVTALDCGLVVNPSGAEAQAEGAVMDAVATVLRWGLTVRDGRVQQGNFDNYPLLRIDEAPVVETILLPSDRPPSGMGEPPYPAAPPAIANALFAAAGRRIRRLPLDWAGLG